MDNSKEMSNNVYAVRMRKYYNSLEGEKKDHFIRKMMEYNKQRYNTDEDYRKKVCEKKKAQYETHIKNNPQITERRRIQSYVYGLNMKHKAGMKIPQTKKYNEYQIFFCEELGAYLSRRMIDDVKVQGQ